MNPQEALWAGEFGNAYTQRNNLAVVNAREFFHKALNRAGNIGSIIEFGANVGTNISALRWLYPGAKMHGVEINESACEKLNVVSDGCWNESILTFAGQDGPSFYDENVGRGGVFIPDPTKRFGWIEPWDLTLVKGLLIHIAPDDLPKAYQALYQASARYILIAEYYSPRMQSIEYRGEKDALWEGPYAEQMLDMFPDLKCIDYSFHWKRDTFPQDDITAFLLEKT